MVYKERNNNKYYTLIFRYYINRCTYNMKHLNINPSRTFKDFIGSYCSFQLVKYKIITKE